MPNELKSLIDKLRSARSVLLSTHRNCDGDGLGAQLALYHGLKQLGKDVRVLNVDRPSPKYNFLGTQALVTVFDPEQGAPPADLALIFDTNDQRLVEPLFSALASSCREVLFIDHHPFLEQGPTPTPGSLIDVSAASTGEIAFNIIRDLGIEMTAEIARALYTAIVFDTQLFRFVKADPRSHLMAAELLIHERQPEEVHRRLFSTYTIEKMAFLARALGQVEYLAEGRLAFISLDATDSRSSGLHGDESADVIDLVMNIENVQVAALMREDAPGAWKISLRSKSPLAVLPLAESLGGGGHLYASGAYVKSDRASLRERLVNELNSLLAKGRS